MVISRYQNYENHTWKDPEVQRAMNVSGTERKLDCSGVKKKASILYCPISFKKKKNHNEKERPEVNSVKY